MIDFSDRQVVIVERLLKSNGVRSKDLLNDLTDHVLCVTEGVMMDGGDFRDGVLTAMTKFDGGKGLRMVERETGFELASIKTKGEHVGWF